uniref:Uncharacterized protein n=1 Tax=Arundo donax TaxID=35708 RepID=A0A0A9FMY6_ARUDO
MRPKGLRRLRRRSSQRGTCRVPRSSPSRLRLCFLGLKALLK